MTNWTEDNLKLYSTQFDNLNRLVGKRIDEIVFYLDPTDIDFSEQPNKYGKSLLNGFDMRVDNIHFSIGNRFTDRCYGLTINEGKTTDFEFIEDDKKPVTYDIKLIGQTIISVDIYWMNIPFEGSVGYYPQEIEIQTEDGYLLISSIEVTNGEVNSEFTDEILIIENQDTAKQLKLGGFGLNENGREKFETISILIQSDEKNYL